MRIVGQAGIERRPVGVMQHVHDVGAVDAGRIVEAGVLIAARLQVDDALVGMGDHVGLGAKIDRLGRAGLGAGRRLADHDTVRAQRALVGLAVDLGDARDVERAALHAIAAADAVLRHEIDDTVGVLHDGARRRAGLQATRIVAVHAAVLADQPFEVVAVLVFREAHHGPGGRRQVGRIVVGAVGVADRLAELVPLQTGGLAGLAADALADIDQLGDFDRGGLVGGRRRHGGGGAAAKIEGLQDGHFTLPDQADAGGCAGGVGFFTSTRNALYSRVFTLAAPTHGVGGFTGRVFR